MRRLTNSSTYKVETDRAVYAVNLKRTTNSYYGHPRFRAALITISVKGEPDSAYLYTTEWSFTGHYMNDQDEARWLVERYEERLKEEEMR